MKTETIASKEFVDLLECAPVRVNGIYCGLEEKQVAALIGEIEGAMHKLAWIHGYMQCRERTGDHARSIGEANRERAKVRKLHGFQITNPISV